MKSLTNHLVISLRKFLPCMIWLSCASLMAQGVAVNTTGAPADTSAMFHMVSTTKGLLLPRMTTAEMNAIPLPAKGLLIFDTTPIPDRVMINKGTTVAPNWQPVNNIWIDGGNSGTNPTTDFLGTTDAVALVFRTNNIRSGLLHPVNGHVMLGYKSGLNMTGLPTQNIAIGTSALQLNSVSGNNIAIGDSALYSATSALNLAIGATAGQHTTTGSNMFIGAGAGNETTSGTSNIAMGSGALYNSTLGQHSRNIAIGRLAMSQGNFGNTGNLAIGALAGFTNWSGFNNTFIGYKAGFAMNQTYHCIFIGDKAGVAADGDYNIAIGQYAFEENDGGNFNIAIGSPSLRENTTGDQNIAIGNDALGQNEEGNFNIGLGSRTGWHNGSGNFNIAIGHEALDGNYSDTPNHNIAIGDSCLHNVESGVGDNTAAGSLAGYSTNTGGNNCYFGSQAASLNTTGSSNVAIGHQALRETLAANGNTAFGHQAGDVFDLGSSNTLIGSFTDVTAGGFTASAALGYNTAVTASDQVRAGWIFTGSIGGYTNWSNLSDGRFKYNIQNNVPGLNFILALRPVTYVLDFESLQGQSQIEGSVNHSDITNVSNRRSGFIAQEVEHAANHLQYAFSGVDAPKNSGDMYTLRYEEFVVPLVQAIQDQQQEILLLKTQSMDMLERLNQLESKSQN